ncbi:auxin response factor 6 isoform X1 [Cryptomeria japonica]|uniref:auxin response factor 6 isoform X1 n=1 Tax=Cryptomeria japonica TaxID=3369 RepID=UPI0027D9F920|nr:auxin response factor 6 isoform X1 [Cryptomeria japonica]
MRNGFSHHHQEGEKRSLNSELWHACAGPLVSLPTIGSHVVYFPQGHSEQVAASTNKEIDSHIPNYPNLPPQLLCQLHNVTLQADIETDEVYAQMTLQPLTTQEQKDSYLAPDLGTQSRQPTNYFCKTLTASDTSTHGGFSIPRRAAEKVFPPLDFTQQPPVQELIARDLHDNEWKFRHIYRGQPKRHLLTTGWSVFVSAKRLVAGDSVLFIRNEKGQLLLGIRRANRTHTVMPSSVLSSDSMHIGVLAAAAHAASTNCRFTIFYNPRLFSCRASPSEFVIPLSKYEKAVYHTRVSIGMRFRMLFETEESTVRRYMGTITGLGDLDPVRWPNSQWRSLKVGWDESTAGERQPRVSLWEIEPLTTFLMYPPPYPLGLKRPWSQLQGITPLYGNDDCSFRRPFISERGDTGETLNFQTIGMDPWMQMQQRIESSLPGIQSSIYSGLPLPGAILQETGSLDQSKQLKFQPQQPLQSEQLQSKPQMQLQKNIVEQQQQQHLLQQQVQVLNLEQQSPNHLLQQQFQRQPLQHQLVQQKLHNSINEPQQSSHQHQQNQQHMFQVTNVSSLPQIPSSQSQSAMSDICSVSSRPVFTNTSTNIVSSKSSYNASPFQSVLDSLTTEGASPYMSLPRSTQSIGQQPVENLTWSSIASDQVAASWFSPKKMSNNRTHCLASGQVEAPLPPGNHHVLTHTEPGFPVNVTAQTLSMPQYPLRDCPTEQEGVHSDSQSNLLFGVNIENPTLAMSDAVSRNIGNGSYVASSFSVTDLLNGPPCGPVSGFPMNSNTNACGGMDESGFSQSTSNVSKMNHPTRTFTKVYKLGSVGRSVDVTRFRGYPELRAELDHMFGLEGQLEDPQRSGWQLVFVDKEKDILLLGDDPWEEFVNNVRSIKILSPPEVLQMSQEGMELLSMMPSQQTTSSSSEDCDVRKASRNIGSVITSTGPLDY